MGKLGSIIKSEMIRLAKREVRQVSAPLGRDVQSLENTVSQLRKSVLAIERVVVQKQKEFSRHEIRLEASPEELKKSRFSPRLIRSLRKKLRITQKELAVLAGVTVGAVHQWEVGKFQPKTVKKARLAALRRITRSDVKKLLEKRRTKSR
jgi:DNA-binding transcriptional regulator YiaG